MINSDSCAGKVWQAFNMLVAAAVMSTLLYGTGCTALGYRLGSSLPADIRSVYVPMFVNETEEPQLEADTTQAVISEFQRDGSLRVSDLENADAVLEVVLKEFRLEPIRYDRDDTRSTSEYRMWLEAEVLFRRTTTQEVLVQVDVHGEHAFDPGGDLGSAKQTALPGAAENLARRIVKNVVEYW